MQLADDIRSLAEQLGARDGSEREYTLVLGSGVAGAAGLPSLDELIERAGLKPEDASDHGIIERLLWDHPVPPFMYDVAGLVRGGSFPRVITTGYDNLLERALIDAGLRNVHHFAVTDLGWPDPVASQPPGSAKIRIVRCHGATAFRPHAMDKALGVRFEASHNVLVVVGYQFESPALDAWLQKLDSCELWWVAPEGDEGAASRIGWRGEWHTVVGEATTPETFFGQLALLLIHSPSAGYPGDPATSPGDDELDRLYVQGRMEQANAVRRSIEQRISSSGADPAAVTQLHAQEMEITKLGQAYRPVEASPEPPTPVGAASPNPAAELLARFKALHVQLEPLVGDASVPVDADTLAFVDGQIDALGREADKAVPNAAVVSAASAALEGLLQSVAPYVREPSR